MAITGIDTIDGKQIIAAGAVSAKSAEMAYNDENGNPITGYLTAVPEGYATENWVTGQGYITDDAITGKQDITGMTAYQPVGNYQTAGDYLTTADSANFYTTANESGFITGVDLTPYQLTADMTAYQPVGDYMTTADSANFYTTANESGFISEVPVGTMNESAFEYDANDKISGYNGSAFAGGSDVPEGVMVESGLEYNAVNEISAYNGSAIAQYGAEKQWLQHDDTLVHVANSAQYALGVNLSAIAQLLGVDETVLWEGSANTGTLNFTDPLTSFKEFKFYVDVPERGINKVLTFYDAVNTVTPGFIQLITTTMTTGSVVNDWWQGVYNINATVDTATYKSMSIYANGQYYKQCSTTACGTNASKLVVKKVIGIGRKA